MTSPKFSQRSSGIEIMDDLNCSGPVVDQTLRELEFINRTLGGNSITLDAVRQLMEGKLFENPEILDMGCGGGDMLLLLREKFQEIYPDIKLQGIDANPNIILYAKEHCGNTLSFSTVNILSKDFHKFNCDIAIATLFFHHFTDDQLVEVLCRLKNQCRIGIVVNDLHRHPLAYYSIKILTWLFSRSSMVKYDAPLSVLRGFTKKELTAILNRAEIKKFSIQWRWAFRWQIVVKTDQV